MSKPTKETPGISKIAALFDAEADLRSAALVYSYSESATYTSSLTATHARNKERRVLRNAAIAYARLVAELEGEP